jgi:NADH-quinone oxidoreductase subunit M
VILAGVLLKMGTYGLIRFAFPLFPEAALYFAPLLATLAVIAIVYGALVAMVQPDMKKLVAYSSVSHMGFVVLGIAAMNVQGVQGASTRCWRTASARAGSSRSSACCRTGGTRASSASSAAQGVMPRLTAAFVIITLSRSACRAERLHRRVPDHARRLPWDPRFVVVAGLGVILSAVYMLWMFQRVFYGESPTRTTAPAGPVGPRVGGHRPAGAMAIFMGVFPNVFLKPMEPAVTRLVQRMEAPSADAPWTALRRRLSRRERPATAARA